MYMLDMEAIKRAFECKPTLGASFHNLYSVFGVLVSYFLLT